MARSRIACATADAFRVAVFLLLGRAARGQLLPRVLKVHIGTCARVEHRLFVYWHVGFRVVVVRIVTGQ